MAGGVVALVAPNGMRVSVAEGKESGFVANGYKPVEAAGSTGKEASSSSKRGASKK